MHIITAPSYESYDNDIKVFLAGGITNCIDWQMDVLNNLDYLNARSYNISIYNPRRKDFDVHNPNAAEEQIAWEFENLNNMDIFSMYFANSESVQPICFYELGRHLEKMKNRFPDDYLDRIVITVNDSFSRKNDVITQCKLALGKDIIKVCPDYNTTYHALDIITCAKKLLKKIINYAGGK